jgi:hypothetical protein
MSWPADFPVVPTTDPCPGRDISYLGRVSCRPVDALTRALLPAMAIGASYRAITYPGPQYWTPLWDGVWRGAAAGGLVGTAVTAMAYTQKWTGNPWWTFGVGLVGLPLALYGSFRVGAIPTA